VDNHSNEQALLGENFPVNSQSMADCPASDSNAAGVIHVRPQHSIDCFQSQAKGTVMELKVQKSIS
jgi:hypothetical protein